MDPRSENSFLALALGTLLYLVLTGYGVIPDFVPWLRPLLYVLAGMVSYVVILHWLHRPPSE